jgi:hypothetical protein
MKTGAIRKIDAHEFERQAEEHYVEPEWCSRRLFDVEKFDGWIWDPACGFGRIPDAARAAGYVAHGSDIVDRGYGLRVSEDYLKTRSKTYNIVTNPPFGTRANPLFKKFALHALEHTRHKVAMIWHCHCLPAAGSWLEKTPLKAIYYLTPRPSMPPGEVITRGEKPGGGKQDFCWLVWDQAIRPGTPPIVRWLHRDGAKK